MYTLTFHSFLYQHCDKHFLSVKKGTGFQQPFGVIQCVLQWFDMKSRLVAIFYSFLCSIVDLVEPFNGLDHSFT